MDVAIAGTDGPRLQSVIVPQAVRHNAASLAKGQGNA